MSHIQQANELERAKAASPQNSITRSAQNARWQSRLQGGRATVAGAHLRAARPTGNLDAVVKFYRIGLGFDVLFRFSDHEGFDGVMMGYAGAPFHLEFARKQGHLAGGAPTQDNLLVFYLPNVETFSAAVEAIEQAGHHPVKSYNPNWDEIGRTFEDSDGYRVFLQNSGWPA